MLLQAADLPVSEFPLITTSQFVSGLLLLLLSAAFKAVVRAIDQDGASVSGAGVSRQRLAARLAQYLALIAGVLVLAAPARSAGQALLLLLSLFLLYLVTLLLGRVAATMAPAGVIRAMRLPLRGWSVVAAPLITLSYWTDSWVQRRSRGPAEDTSERLEALLESSGLGDEDLKLISNALRFRDRSVGELMVPRPDVTWLSTNDDPARVRRLASESGHSRFPLCLDSPDQVVGYVHVRDLELHGFSANAQDLRAIARPVSFVPETAEAMSLLRRFQREKSHMAVVVDEFGGMAGIVTLEDLLEELVGEIRDEFDHEEEVDVTLLRNGEVLVDGSVRLDDLERGYGLDFGDVEEETVGGFVFGRLAREVSAGDEVDLEGAVLRVEGVEGLRVTRVRVIPAAEPELA
jgi:CBS domain containing-hemolysin-like protein